MTFVLIDLPTEISNLLILIFEITQTKFEQNNFAISPSLGRKLTSA